MKYIIILADGVADLPLKELGGMTPLMAARKPNIDALCKKASTGRLVTVPPDMPAGSEVANLGVLGYDVHAVYQGRGVLEAASLGVPLDDDDLALRCNLICIENEKIKNHSAGHIATHESHELVNALNDELGSDRVSFYPGVSYRHLLVIKNGNNNIVCTPPHDVPGTQFREVLVKATKPDGQETAGLLNELIMKSQKVLQEHPVNQKRRTQGKDPANSLWPWAAGHKPQMKTLRELYGITGAVISAVDLIKGIGVYAGMKVMEVKGATGLHDTNYEGKARAAISALRDVDLVYLHIEASDEAGHEGNVALKIKTIELLDERVVKLIVSEVAKMSEPVTIAILPDHPTPCAVRTHTHDPVPFLIYRPSELGDAVSQYDEESVKAGSYGLLTGDGFMRALLNIESFNFVQDR